MRTIKAGLALAIVGSVLLAPLAAAGRRQDGIISGSAAAEAKQPFSKYVMRARDVSNNQIAQTTTLDANAEFALNGLAAGSFMVELVKGASARRSGRQDRLHGRSVHAAGQRVAGQRPDDQEGRERAVQPPGGGLLPARRGRGSWRHGGRRRHRRRPGGAAAPAPVSAVSRRAGASARHGVSSGAQYAFARRKAPPARLRSCAGRSLTDSHPAIRPRAAGSSPDPSVRTLHPTFPPHKGNSSGDSFLTGRDARLRIADTRRGARVRARASSSRQHCPIPSRPGGSALGFIRYHAVDRPDKPWRRHQRLQ